MLFDLLQLSEADPTRDGMGVRSSPAIPARARRVHFAGTALGMCCVPISIAVSEFFLAVAFGARLLCLIRGKDRLLLPSALWFGIAWAALEIAVSMLSPEPRLAWSEIRHLLLIAALFLLLSGAPIRSHALKIWKGVFLAATLSSLFLIGDFVSRLFYYRRELAAGGDVGLYLRSGGLLNHWMVFATVEVIVIAALVNFWELYPEQQRRWWPVAVINAIAIVVSLTRMAWITCFLLVTIDLMWRRSKWLLALPLLPLALYVVSPRAVRARVHQSLSSDYYSNLERIEMLRVGWQMTGSHPLTGVGPGRIDKLYLSYLSADDPIPAYHAHLHNNVVELAAEFGIPVTLAALLFVLVLFRDLLRASRAANAREEVFIYRTGILSLTGFLVAGLFEYTYGHSLGLVVLSFALIPAITLRLDSKSESNPDAHSESAMPAEALAQTGHEPL